MDRKDKAQVRDISKKINRTGYQRQHKIQKTRENTGHLEEFSGIKFDRTHKTRKKVLVTHVRNKSGNIDAMRKGITNVFAEFYKDFFRRRTMK